MSETPRVDAVAPVEPFLTDSDQWAVSKTDYDCLLDVARSLERALAQSRSEGRREGLEEAAKVCRERVTGSGMARDIEAMTCAADIRALISAPEGKP